MFRNLKALTRKSSFFQLVVNILLISFFIIELYPLVYIVSCSVSDMDAVAAGEIYLFPKGFTLRGYEKVFEYSKIWIGYGNTLLYTVVGTMINLAVTLPCAYALSRKDLIGKKAILFYFMVTMYIGGGLIPNYLNIRSFGLLDTRTVILILGALSIYNMIVARTFFTNSIPYELTEAARIDGCNDFSLFFKIVLPLSKALIVVMILYYGVARWNSYFDAMIYLDSEKLYPLQLFLRKILLLGQLASDTSAGANLTLEEVEALEEMRKAAELIKYCVIIVATLPMLIIYPWIQKYFEKGVMIGSVKG